MIRAAFIALMVLSLGLSGCGKKGDPEPPAAEEERQG